jgi:hypothetical protein
MNWRDVKGSGRATGTIILNRAKFWNRKYQNRGYSAVGIANRRSGVRVPAWAKNFSLLHNVQTGSGGYQASYSVGAGIFITGWGIKWPERDADHSSTYIIYRRGQNEWSYTSTPSVGLCGFSEQEAEATFI